LCLSFTRDQPLAGNTECIVLSTETWLLTVRASSLQMVMWHRFNNLFSSLQAYDALSPDLRVRRQVNQALRQRPAMPPEQWFQTFFQPQGIPYTLVSFAYEHLARYSGLEFSRVLPDDRLNEDLQWTQVCWFDWEQHLCADFDQQFGTAIGDQLSEDLNQQLDQANLLTVRDLLALLNRYSKRLCP
jgi:hypothetical protein